MDIESSIRSRIETVLLHDAQRYAELRQALAGEEPIWVDPVAQERELYERIITTCRSAVAEVNSLLEENIEFLSGFCRIVEGIKEKTDVEEICIQIATCALHDFRAEYCAIVLFEDTASGRDRLCLEAVREHHTVLRMHSTASLLGNSQFEAVITHSATQTGEWLNSPDVYRDPRFARIDWPSVVRSLACLPITLHGKCVGALVLAHSMPSSFHENHFRVLKILAGMIAHVRLLTSAPLAQSEPVLPQGHAPDQFSVVLFSFETCDTYGRVGAPDSATLREVCRVLAGALLPCEPILPHGETEFIALLPGTDEESVSVKVRALREAFGRWCATQSNGRRRIRMNLGFSTCRPGENLSRVLEIASAVMHPECDE